MKISLKYVQKSFKMKLIFTILQKKNSKEIIQNWWLYVAYKTVLVMPSKLGYSTTLTSFCELFPKDVYINTNNYRLKLNSKNNEIAANPVPSRDG